ncbi:MAG: thiamine pyrophosphate-dependent enzyme, partial [Pseudomonadota bacterium]
SLPVVFVVMNNAELGMIRRLQKERPLASEFMGDDFAKIAEGYGCQGIRVEKPSEFPEALTGALHSGKPSVIDVVIDKTASVGPIISG